MITKRVPVAAGLGGGSSDAATALRLANLTLAEPLPPTELHRLAAGLGADVPFFLTSGPQLGRGDGSELSPLELPQDYWVRARAPARRAEGIDGCGLRSASTSGTGRTAGTSRRAALDDALAGATRARRLAELPPNDLASSPLAAELVRLGAFRADVTGAGPTVYGLFLHRRHAEAAQLALGRAGRTWLTVPTWYG